MSDKIYFLISSVRTALDGGWIFIISIALELALFLAVTFISIFKKNYSLKKRAWFFISSLAILALELAFLSITNELTFFYLSLAVTLGLWCAVVLTLERKIKIKKEHRELAKILDQRAREEPSSPSFPVQQEISPPIQNYDEATRFELDFQHVKLVIQKLEYYPLSASDRKQVRDLEENVCQAENEGFTSALKNKINDGLGALLKIMSKYGV